MGLLRDPSGATITLSARCLVGRTAACALRIHDARVSSEHAVLAWREGWTVRDLGSRNGTFVDGEAVGREQPLHRGSAIGFGSLGPWVLVEDGPPVPRAEDLSTGALVTAPGDVLTLPPGDSPSVSVVPRSDGSWALVLDADVQPVVDLDVIVVRDQRWRLYLPTTAEPTVAEAAIHLSFLVSTDEEQVSVRVDSGGRSVTLRPRGHHYLLLLLARARLADRRGDRSERGWVHRHDLARMLHCDPSTINVQLHRVRQDLGAVDRAAALLETRVRSGQVRLGTERLTIERG